jgi:hypothetical protein
LKQASPWKQQEYDRDKKSHEAMQKLKSALHVASRGEWQLDYETQGEFHQYYSTTQKELYGGKYPNSLKSFMSTMPRAPGKYFQMRYINERNRYFEWKTVEHVLKEYPLHPAERDYLRKVSPELDSMILLIPRRALKR